MKVIFAALIIAMHGIPALADADSKANKLLVESIQIMKNMSQDLPADERLLALKNADEKLDAIIREYPESDVAVKLLTNDFKIINIDAIKGEIRGLEYDKRSAECRKNPNVECLPEILLNFAQNIDGEDKLFAQADAYISMAYMGDTLTPLRELRKMGHDEDLSDYFQQIAIEMYKVGDFQKGDEIVSESGSPLSNYQIGSLLEYYIENGEQQKINELPEVFSEFSEKDIGTTLVYLNVPFIAIDFMKSRTSMGQNSDEDPMKWDFPLRNILMFSSLGSSPSELENIISAINKNFDIISPIFKKEQRDYLNILKYKLGVTDDEPSVSPAPRNRLHAAKAYRIFKASNTTAALEYIGKINDPLFRSFAAQDLIYWLIEDGLYDEAAQFATDPTILRSADQKEYINEIIVEQYANGGQEQAMKLMKSSLSSQTIDQEHTLYLLTMKLTEIGKASDAVSLTESFDDPLTIFMGYLGVFEGLRLVR